MTALLDVNFLVALFHPQHVHHVEAHRWFQVNAANGWATCPVTINGAIRVLSNASVGLVDARAAEVARRLRLLSEHPQHEFWADGVSLLDSELFALELVQGHRQLTDVYLLGVAVRHQGYLVTFDRGIPVGAVRGAREWNLAKL